MKLKYNRKNEREVVGLGVFKPNQIITEEDETKAKRYLNSSYFDEVKKRKKRKPKKSKMKGVDK